MESLETEVREGLIQKAAQATYEVMQDPEYQLLLRESVKAIDTFFVEPFGLKESDPELDALLDESLETFFSNPDQLRLHAYKAARNQYLTRKRISLELEALYGQLKHEENYESLAAALTTAIEPLYPILDARENVVRELVALAEREGIEKALTDEAEYAAIQKVFPTKEAYMNNQFGGVRAFEDFAVSVQESLSKGEESDENPSLRGLIRVLETVTRKEILKKADAIYGA
ncbi:MAG: hypothetical protein Q8R53_01075 [Nanoarchaeota archaeon]|nr:hypothetical protein [Nanoarchaeota archaeon]